MLHDDRRDVGDEVGVHAVAVLDDRALAYLRDRELQQPLLLADLLAEQVLLLERGLHDLAVHEVVGHGIETGVILALEDIRQFDVGILLAFRLEYLDADEVVGHAGELVADQVVGPNLLAEYHGLGIGVPVVPLHPEFLFGDLSEPIVGFLGLQQGYSGQRRGERQNELFHGGQF